MERLSWNLIAALGAVRPEASYALRALRKLQAHPRNRWPAHAATRNMTGKPATVEDIGKN
jgi:hypothetical protein